MLEGHDQNAGHQLLNTALHRKEYHNVETPMVYAVVVTWNKKKDVLKLLEQLGRITYPLEKLGIIVVDNNSTDGTAEAVESLYPSVELIRNRENLGGSGGFNTGMKWALKKGRDCEYLWLLDNDVLVHPDALKALVAVMKKNSSAGLCGSKILNIDNHDDLIEIGAFIDYRIGDISRNIPDKKELADPDSVFEVDYVAACSLLARMEFVRKLGLWDDRLFIYWDDMEWGARFNTAGYKVLASNASIVYHPSWEGRTFYHSAIWRYYYRVRNALWFFNNYCTGIGRRILLVRLILRFMRFAMEDGIRSYSLLSRSFMRGVDDFFIDSFGKKQFRIPANDLEKHIDGKKIRNISAFIHDSETADTARDFVCDLKKKFTRLKVLAVIPDKDEAKWKGISDDLDIITYTCTKSGNGCITIRDKFKIFKFLAGRSWDLLLTSLVVPRIGSIWGKYVARVNFTKGLTVAIEKVNFKDLCCIPLLTLFYLIRVVVYPPHQIRSGKD